MAKQSAGILLYRFKNKKLEVLLTHPGGPFFRNKDLGAWSIPKGEFEAEDPFEAAKREFKEETGGSIAGKAEQLTPQKLKSGKIIHAWAVQGDFDPKALTSNPSKFGWPEADRAEWFNLNTALQKINSGQAGFIKELAQKAKGLSKESGDFFG